MEELNNIIITGMTLSLLFLVAALIARIFSKKESTLLKAKKEAFIKKQIALDHRFEQRKQQLLDLGFEYDEMYEAVFVIPSVYIVKEEKVRFMPDEEWAYYLGLIKENIKQQ
jgi:hypothetical protein